MSVPSSSPGSVPSSSPASVPADGPVMAWVVRSSLWSGVLSGVGLAAFLDEAMFHQLLHWHHFYDRSTSAVGLVSDGLFHAFGFTAVVVGLFLLADAHRRQCFAPRRWWGGLLVGLGAFQLYDGTVQHKLLRLHQIRYGVPLWPYDLTWDLVAVAALVVGVLLLRGPAALASGRLLAPGGPARR